MINAILEFFSKEISNISARKSEELLEIHFFKEGQLKLIIGYSDIQQLISDYSEFGEIQFANL